MKIENIDASILLVHGDQVELTISEISTNREVRRFPNYEDMVRSIGRQRFWNGMAGLTSFGLIAGGLVSEAVSAASFIMNKGVIMYSSGDAVADQIMKLGVLTGGVLLFKKVSRDDNRLLKIEAEQQKIAKKIPSLLEDPVPTTQEISPESS